MNFRVFWAIVALLPTMLMADQAPSPLHSLLNQHQDRIYLLGSTTGGSPQAWSDLEAQMLRDVKEAIAANPQALTMRDQTGATPLIHAALVGNLVVVTELLSHDTVKATIKSENNFGSDAFDLSQLSLFRSGPACKPALWEPEFLPFVVVMLAYYQDRAPYPAVAQALIDAGADPSLEKVRTALLKNCELQDQAAREAVIGSSDLARTLAELGTIGPESDRRAKADEATKIANLHFQQRIVLRKSEPEALEQAIKALYGFYGLQPSTDLK